MLKTLIDNWGMLRVMSHLMKSIGGAKGLKLFSQYDKYYTAEAVKAALACGASCERPGNDFQRLLFDIARRRLGRCPPPEVERPREPAPALMREYFEMVEDVVVSKACELAAKPVRDVIPEEEARALYQALVSADIYKAFRVSLYLGTGAARWGRVLLIGAGTQEPLDFLKACELAEAKCEVAAMEVDEVIFRDLARLAERRGFKAYLGWDSLGEGQFDGAVAQNVLHWASDPLDVLVRARRHASRLLVSQVVIEGSGIGFVLTYVLGAVRFLSWREVEALARQAGWRLERRYAKYPDYIAVYTRREQRR